MKFYIVDAFTQKPFGGNTAGVVLLDRDAAFPEDEIMRQTAAELRYSETAFVRQDGPSEFTVRYFTPRYEVDLCGHATIATFGTLFQEGIVPAGTRCLNHTKAGDLEVVAGGQVMMQMAAAEAAGDFKDPALLDALLGAMGGLRREDLAPLPVETISTGLPDIILPVRDLDVLQSLRPDMSALTDLSTELDVVGVHAFATMPGDGYTAHTRNFAPRYAVPEESATGTANAALTAYLFRQKIISDGASCRFLQGEAMGRPSLVLSTLTLRDGAPDIRIGGPCAIVARGEIGMPGQNRA
ncbi:MAG: PhzF family phenazine biosynthesis protein [Bacteroidales bacterium]|nr:PhzF family phenazine biosynthesis protein [Bacteroidales bacterium]